MDAMHLWNLPTQPIRNQTTVPLTRQERVASMDTQIDATPCKCMEIFVDTDLDGLILIHPLSAESGKQICILGFVEVESVSSTIHFC